MGFFEGNYWGDEGGNAPKAVKDPATVVKEIRQSGGKPTPQQVAAALEYLDQTSKGPAFTSATAMAKGGPFGPGDIGTLEGNTQAMRDNFARTNPDPVWDRVKTAPTYSNAKDNSTFMGGVGDKLSDAFGKLQDLARGLSGGGGGQQSVMDLYRQLQEQYGQYKYTGPSAEDMARQEFDPQYKLLEQMAKQQGARNQQAQTETAQGYRAMVDDVLSGRNDNKAMSDQQVKQTNTNYESAAKGLSGTFDDSARANAEFLASLGVLEGQDSLMDQSEAAKAEQLGRLGSQQQISTDLASQLGTNQYQADTADVGITRQAGRNTADQFAQQYMDQMAQNDQTRLGLQGAQEQAKNAYAMQIQKMIQEGQGGINTQIQDTLDMLLRERSMQSEDAYRQAGLDLDQARFGLEQDKFGASQAGAASSNPYDALSQRAMGIYGDPGKARQMTDVVLSWYLDNPNADIREFMSKIPPEMLRSNPELQSLAFDFYNGIMNSKLNTRP